MRDLSVEEHIQALAKRSVSSRSEEFAIRGLDVDVDIAGWPDADGESSELRITFWNGNNLIDRLETFVFEDGRQAATKDEFRQWLEQELATVLRENPVQR